MGCGYIQGYYYAKPMPVPEYEKIIRNQVKGIPEPFEEVKVKEDAAVLWTQDAKIQAIFDQVHFPSGVCTEDHGKIYPLLVNNAYIAKYGYGSSIIDPEEKNSLIKEEKQMQMLYRLLEKSFEEKSEAIESREEKDEKGNLIRRSGLVDYMFSINNQRVYFFAVIEQKQ